VAHEPGSRVISLSTLANTTVTQRRGPGRPRGAKTAVLRSETALGVQHFAFLRAWLQGLELKVAWDRYLAFAEASSDLRHIERCRRALLTQLLHDGQQINLTLPPAAKIDEALSLLAQGPAAPPARALPSLAEFAQAQGFDPDQFSEAELLAEYQDFYGLDGAPESDRLTVDDRARRQRAQLRALNQLESLLARTPQPGDRIELWFAPATLPGLRAVGAATLGALLDHIDVHGPGWFKRVRGLGATRAAALLAWLAPLAQAWGRPLRQSVFEPPQRQRALRAATLHQLVLSPRFAIVPLEQLSVPPHLAGGAEAPGIFASRMANSLGAHDDLAALRAWLRPYRESTATHRAYSKEVERFYLWCLHVRRKPLSSVDSADCLAYREFLAQLPQAWIQPAPLPRDDPAWRPFRGPLKPSSQRYALVVVQTLFDGLRDANYLVANPMVSVRKRAQLPEPAMQVDRSFDDAEWAFVMAQLDREEVDALARAGASGRRADRAARPRPGAEQRRLRLVLSLLCSTGLRLSELVSATTESVSTVVVDAEEGEGSTAWVISVIGKGRKLRQVPLGDEIAALIRAHHDDAHAVAPLPRPVPIVCTLGRGVGRWQEAPEGVEVRLQAAAFSCHRQLGANGLYRSLKRFFQRIAGEARAVDGLSAERMRAASTHWLRHTFGRQGAADGVPVEVLQQAFGHASLNTTTTYLTTERSRMIRVLRDARARRASTR
jgi:site-specific recombinase XerD